MLGCIVLVGCGTTRVEIDVAKEKWGQRPAAEIPPGTDVAVAMRWFEQQGLQAHPKYLEKTNDLDVLVESIPAREWYCSNWFVKVDIRVSPEQKVTRYDVEALGRCL